MQWQEHVTKVPEETGRVSERCENGAHGRGQVKIRS
jgi:hypothetical protein